MGASDQKLINDYKDLGVSCGYTGNVSIGPVRDTRTFAIFTHLSTKAGARSSDVSIPIFSVPRDFKGVWKDSIEFDTPENRAKLDDLRQQLADGKLFIISDSSTRSAANAKAINALNRTSFQRLSLHLKEMGYTQQVYNTQGGKYGYVFIPQEGSEGKKYFVDFYSSMGIEKALMRVREGARLIIEEPQDTLRANIDLYFDSATAEALDRQNEMWDKVLKTFGIE